MSGIAGRFSLDGRTAEPWWSAPPVVSRSGLAISFDGRLDNRQELTRFCGSHGPDSSNSLSDAAYVAAAYEHAGDGFASRLNGDFALALFDSRQQQLFLARDVMGARRLHYTRQNDVLFF